MWIVLWQVVGPVGGFVEDHLVNLLPGQQLSNDRFAFLCETGLVLLSECLLGFIQEAVCSPEATVSVVGQVGQGVFQEQVQRSGWRSETDSQEGGFDPQPREIDGRQAFTD